MTVLPFQVIMPPAKRSVTTVMDPGVGKIPRMEVTMINNVTLTAIRHAQRISDHLVISAHVRMAIAYMAAHRTVMI
jgi:hypothetical protein